VSVANVFAISRLFLIGPMGAGKTTIGRRLAQVLRREFSTAIRKSNSAPGPASRSFLNWRAKPVSRREKAVIAELTQRLAI
jgi:shikimate kinase